MTSRRPDPDLVVLLCRGCCCGTTGKHPQVDHESQLAELEAAVEEAPGVELRVVDCLDECDRSNVVVLRRQGAGKGGRPAERDTWLGGLLTRRATGELAEWLRDGGADALPPAVSGLRFRHVPPRRRAKG